MGTLCHEKLFGKNDLKKGRVTASRQAAMVNGWSARDKDLGEVAVLPCVGKDVNVGYVRKSRQR